MRITLLGILMLLNTSILFAQKDTIFYDEAWQVTTKGNHAFYRPQPVEKNGLYLLKDYYKTGELQFEGYSSSLTEDSYEGEVKWFYTNGKLKQLANYKNNLLDGVYKVYDADGNIFSEGVYKEGEPQSGSFALEEETYKYLSISEYKDGKCLSQTVKSTHPKSKAKMIFYYKSEPNTQFEKVEFWDQNEKYLGATEKINEYNMVSDGLMVGYLYNPMVVSISYKMENSIIQGLRNNFYSNGQIKFTEELDDNESPKQYIYFDEKGVAFDSLSFKDGYAFDGTQINYFDGYTNSELADHPELIAHYRKGMRNGAHLEYYPNGKLYISMQYIDDVISGTRLEYDTLGNLRYSLTYQDGEPWTGTMEDYNKTIITYESGIITSEKRCYPNGKTAYELDIDKGETYYDSLGKVTHKLEYKDKTPFNGTHLSLSSDFYIESSTTYKEGVRIEESSYTDKLIYHTDKYNSLGDRIGEIDYYTNGKKKSETLVKDYYTIKKSFFSQDGKLLGTIDYSEDYPYKGKEILFDEDRITGEETYVNGVQTETKKFQADGKLLYHINILGNSTFINTKTNKTEKCSYKDKAPFNGTYIEYDSYSDSITTIRPYKNGEVEGVELNYAFDYDNDSYNLSNASTYKKSLLDGSTKKYKNGVVIAVENYKEGVLDGTTEYFDFEGKSIGTMSYSMGNALTGTLIEFDYDNGVVAERAYQDGMLQGLTKEYYDGVIYAVKTYDKNSIQKCDWYEEGEVKYSLTYKDDLPFDGVEMGYYSLSYYKNGVNTNIDYFTDETYTSKERVVEIVDNNYKSTRFYLSGKKKAVFTGDVNNQEREVKFYSADEKLIATGKTVDNNPVSGSVVFFNTSDENKYILMSIAKKTINVSIIEGTKTIEKFNYELTEEADLTDKIAQVINFLYSNYYDYNLSITE